MRQFLYSLLVLLCIICTSTTSFAQQVDNDHRILFKSGTTTFTNNVDEFIAQPYLNDEVNEKYLYRLIQFKDMPTTNTKNQLDFLGVKLLEYIPNKAYIAAIPINFNHQLLKNFNIRTVIKMPVQAKLDEYLRNEVYPNWSVEGEHLILNLKLNRLIKYQEVISVLGDAGVTILDYYPRNQLIQIQIQKSAASVQQVANFPFVNYIETNAPPAEPEQLIGNTLVRANTLQNIGYDGTGVNVQTRDNYNTGPHIDFEGRIQYISTNNVGTHGVAVSGIFAGAGNLTPDNIGSATGSQMYITDYAGNFQDTTYGLHLYDGVKVTNSSYGDGCNNGYTSRAQTVDNQIYNSPTLMHVFSAGNSNGQDCSYGAGTQWGNITGGHKTGKNVLAIGSLTNTGVISNFSSRGPSTDGRIKPDIMAMGTNVTSINPNNTYSTGSGTSFSAPSLAGVFAQLIHAYKNFNNGQEPESALIKAALLNTANDLGNVGPDFIHGWGMVNSIKAHDLLKENRYFTGTVAQGNTNTHSITIPAGVEEARIMVYWMDPQGSLVTVSPLVNNLDMSVVSPSMTTTLPLILDPTPNPTNLNTPATPGVDNLNNMEQVRLSNPAAGTYTVNVGGTTVPLASKEYYVLYEFLTDDIAITYPAGGEGFEPGESVRIHWDAHTGTNSFALEYSTDTGATWNSITTAANQNARSYNWSVPNNVFTDQAMIRITRGTVVEESNIFTIIGKPTNITVDSACVTELYVSWNNVPNATGYDVFLLGNKYMDSVTTTSALFAGAPVSATTGNFSEWIAVRARYNSGAGQRSNAVFYGGGLFGCTYPDDLELTLIAPTLSLSSCGTDSSVVVFVENIGGNHATGVSVSYQLNNGAIVTESIAGTIDTSVTYTFSTPLTPQTNTLHTLKAWVNYNLDAFPLNDTVSTQVLISAIETLPYSYNFENLNNCGTANNCGATICDLGDGWQNFENGPLDNIDWRTDNGGTNSTNTGPSTDFSPGTSAGKYLYLEASGCFNETALLLSPCIDLTSAVNPIVTLGYHMFGGDMGSLHIDVFSNGTWTNDIIPAISGNQGNVWNTLQANLSSFTGSVINIRVRGLTGNGFESDIAIDDFNIFDFNTAPTANFTSSLNNTCVSLPIEFSDSSLYFVTNWKWEFTPNTVNFINGTSDSSENPVVIFSSIGSYDVKLIATNANGSDTITKSSFVNITNGISLPMTEDFETYDLCGTTANCELEICPLGNGWRNDENGTEDDIDWRVSEGTTFSANTGPTTDHNPGTATGNYLYLEASQAGGGCTFSEAALVSPCIDLTTALNPQFSLWYHMLGANIGQLHVDILSNGVWTNDVTPSISGNQGNQWQELTFSLASYIGQSVTLRIRGITGAGFASDIAIDNFNIFDITTPPVAGMSVNQPTCKDNTTFMDNSTNGANSYQWNFGPNATPQTAIGAGPHTVAFSSANDQMVQLISSSPVGNDTIIQTVTNIDSLPTAGFTYSPANEIVTFTNTSINGNTYLWSFGDNTFSSNANPGAHIYGTSGNYTVTLTVTNDCGSTITTQQIQIIVTDIDRISYNEWSIELFPNPNNGQFKLQLDGVRGDIGVSIIDIQGRLVRNWNYSNVNNDWNTTINASELASGIYIVKVATEVGVKNVKLLIE